MFIDENLFFILIISNVILLLCLFLVYISCKYTEARNHKQRLDLITICNEEFQKKLEKKLNGFYKENNKDFNNVANIYLVFNTSILAYKFSELGFCDNKKIRLIFNEAEKAVDEHLNKAKKLQPNTDTI